jgi:hypothetical protein
MITMKSAIRETRLQNLQGSLIEIKQRGKKRKRSFLRKQLQNHAASRMVVGSSPDEVTEFLSIYIILPAALGPGVHSASERNEYQKQKSNVSGE